MRHILRVLVVLLIFASCAFSQQGTVGGVFGAVQPRLGQQPAAAATCSADGVVVDSATGAPVVRAHVSAGGMGQGGSSAITDAQGRWSLTGLFCGGPQISAQKTGYVPSFYGQVKPGRPSHPLQLQDGSPAHDLKIEMTPQSVVVGKVVDENGDPMQNVQIQLIASATQDGKRTWQPRGGTQTNDLGEYRMHGLMAGKYIVCARPNMMNMGGMNRGSQRTVYAETCFPGPPEGNSASTLDLQPGRENKVDFNVAPTQGVSIRGTVSGNTRNGVGIQLRKRQSNMMGGQPTNVNFLPDGRFEVSGVTPGSYYLMANIWDREGRMSAEVPVDVGTTDLEGVAMQLAPGFAVTGTVQIETTRSGSAQQAGGQGWFNVARLASSAVISPSPMKMPADAGPMNIMLRSADGQMGMGQLKWSDDKKSFTISDIMPGRYRFEVNAFGNYYVKSMRLQGRDVLNEEITLQQAAGPLEVVVSDATGKVQGTVTGADGQAASGQVLLIPDSGGRPQFGFANPEGKFTAMNVPPGTYKAYAWSDPQQAEWANPDWMREFGGGGVPVTVAPGQNATADLKQIALP